METMDSFNLFGGAPSTGTVIVSRVRKKPASKPSSSLPSSKVSRAGPSSQGANSNGKKASQDERISVPESSKVPNGAPKANGKAVASSSTTAPSTATSQPPKTGAVPPKQPLQPRPFPMSGPSSSQPAPSRHIGLSRGTRILSQDHLQKSTTDSPDPLAIRVKTKIVPDFKSAAERWDDISTMAGSRQVQQSPTTAPALPASRRLDGKSSSVLVPSSETSSNSLNGRPRKKLKSPKSLRGRVKGKDAAGTDTSEDEATPRPSQKGKIKEKSKEPSPVPINDNGAAAFFAQASVRRAEELSQFERQKLRMAEMESALSTQQTAVDQAQRQAQEFIDEQGNGGAEDLSAEEFEYLESRNLVSTADFCRFCGEPLPRAPSTHLADLELELDRLQRSIGSGRQLTWQQYGNYCRRHEAEKTVIPLGRRAGFPYEIDFSALRDRLELPEIRDRLETICQDPGSSTFFADAAQSISEKGKLRWLNLSNKAQTSRAAPGYYGELGRRIIMDHLLLLARHRLLPPNLRGKNPISIQPLSKVEFLQIVLVPEAAVALIMLDRGWDGIDESREFWEDALSVRTESCSYGQCQSPEHGETAAMVLKTYEEDNERWIRTLYENRGRDIETKERRRTKNAERPHEVIEISSDASTIPSSSSDMDEPQSDPLEDEEADRENTKSRHTTPSRGGTIPPSTLVPPSTIKAKRSHIGTRSTTRSRSRSVLSAIRKGSESREVDVTLVSTQASSNYDAGFDDEELLRVAEAAERGVE